jgi:hypothetical protein
MRLAYIILAHRYPEQLARRVDRLAASGGASFFVRIDREPLGMPVISPPA